VLPLKPNNATDRLPPVTLGLIVANVVAYLLAVFHGGGLFSGPAAHTVLRFGLTPTALAHGKVLHIPHAIPAWETFFTAMFLHASLLHLAGNLLFLWIFGPNVEAAIGHARYLGFYLAGGVAALALQTLLHPNSTAPTIGAEGPIAAVIAGYVVLYPRAKILAVSFVAMLVTVIEIPLAPVLALYLGLQAVFAATHLTNPLGGADLVSYFPYLGGALLGLLTIRLLTRQRPSESHAGSLAI
jgi:membrane associated rhomboid family serine protease